MAFRIEQYYEHFSEICTEQSLEKIEMLISHISDTQTFSNQKKFLLGLACFQIQKRNWYIDKGFKNWRSYVSHHNVLSKFSKSTLDNYINAARNFILLDLEFSYIDSWQQIKRDPAKYFDRLVNVHQLVNRYSEKDIINFIINIKSSEDYRSILQNKENINSFSLPSIISAENFKAMTSMANETLDDARELNELYTIDNNVAKLNIQKDDKQLFQMLERLSKNIPGDKPSSLPKVIIHDQITDSTGKLSEEEEQILTMAYVKTKPYLDSEELWIRRKNILPMAARMVTQFLHSKIGIESSDKVHSSFWDENNYYNSFKEVPMIDRNLLWFK